MKFVNGIEKRVPSWMLPRDRDIELTGRSVFITGGSRGLGLELAREFGKRGARIALFARDLDECRRAQADLVAHGVHTVALHGDVRQRSDVEAAVAAAREHYGRIDILVNNAGVIQVGPLDTITLDDYREAMDTHFWGAMAAIDAVLPEMRARRDGRIVNVSSIGGRISVPHLLPYSASKFALAGYSEGLRAELIRERVYVTTVIPGLMRTGSPENAEFKGKHRAEYTWFSIADSLPFLSVDVTEAARQIVEATKRGDAVTTISIPAKIAAFVHGAFPSLVAEANGVVARLLPKYGGIGSQKRRGADSHGSLSPSPITAATQHRAVTQNQTGAS